MKKEIESNPSLDMFDAVERIAKKYRMDTVDIIGSLEAVKFWILNESIRKVDVAIMTRQLKKIAEVIDDE